jgi:hypothetical protein
MPLVGPGAVIYVCSFRKIVSGIQTLIEEGDSQIHRQPGDLISLLLFLKDEESYFLQFPMNREQPEILELRNLLTTFSSVCDS